MGSSMLTLLLCTIPVAVTSVAIWLRHPLSPLDLSLSRVDAALDA